MGELPQIVMLGRPYFFDRRLRQLRRRDNPHDAIDLSGDESETLAAIIADSAPCVTQELPVMPDEEARALLERSLVDGCADVV